MSENCKKKTLVNFILDKSGSMATVADDTRGGFNSYIDELRKDQGSDFLFSLTMFDTDFSAVHVAVPLEKVEKLTTDNYVPGGCTALLDAIGATVRKVEAEKLAVEKVLTVIMTDGHENSSREWRLEGIKKLIEEKEALGNWTFVFLGATPDAWDIGQGLGVQAGNAYQYKPSETLAVFDAVARSTSALSSSPELSTSCFVPSSGSGISTRSPNRPTVSSQPRQGEPKLRHFGKKQTYKSGIWQPKQQ